VGNVLGAAGGVGKFVASKFCFLCFHSMILCLGALT
jgi:hypothetical protein